MLLATLGHTDVFKPATASLKGWPVKNGLGDVKPVLCGSGTLVVDGIPISVPHAQVRLKA